MANLPSAGPVVNAVTDAILQTTSDAHVRLAMLVGSKMEGGWNPTAVGDGGTSFGSFQIHLPAHPGVTAQEAEDPTFAAKYMLGAYQSGVSQVSPSLWSSNPALAAATAAFYAERPFNMYASSAYTSAYSSSVQVLGGANLGGTGSADSGTNGTGGVQTASFLGFDVGTILKPLQSLMNTGYCFAIIVGGAAVMGVGFYWMFKGSTPSIPSINVRIPDVKIQAGPTERGSATRPDPARTGDRSAVRRTYATRVGSPGAFGGGGVRVAARKATAVSGGSKREIERVK